VEMLRNVVILEETGIPLFIEIIQLLSKPVDCVRNLLGKEAG
jgi:hypothetical protein